MQFSVDELPILQLPIFTPKSIIVIMYYSGATALSAVLHRWVLLWFSIPVYMAEHSHCSVVYSHDLVNCLD